MSATRGAWIVATSIFAVEALKDQGFCRWNYALRSAQQRAKTNLISYYQAHRVSAMRSSSVISGKMREEKMKQTEQSLKKVMELSCWGPSTVRF